MATNRNSYAQKQKDETHNTSNASVNQGLEVEIEDKGSDSQRENNIRLTNDGNVFKAQSWENLEKIPPGFTTSSRKFTINFQGNPMLRNFSDPEAAQQQFLEVLADFRNFRKEKMTAISKS